MDQPNVSAPVAASPDAQTDAGPQGEADRSREPALLTTGEMARLSNSTLRTVRFYEEEGILRPAKRTEGGHRLFERTELDRLMLVTDLRMAGLSLDDIKAILEVKRAATSGTAAAESAIKVLGVRITELREKLTVLNRLRDDLEETSRIVSGCLACQNETSFPDGCAKCSVMTQHPALPRSVRVLWSVGQCTHEHLRRASPEAPAAPKSE
ncbi:MAG TPA: MerR family transcriptional regulator [Polyangium sp.]|nr:MerR family transcriptional regulator [Polyangium sp.]